MSSVTAQGNSDERAGLVGFATLLQVDGVIQPQDLVWCQKPIYLLKKLLWTAHKPQLQLFSSTDSCFSVGMASGRSPGFPAVSGRSPTPPPDSRALRHGPLSRGSSPPLCTTTLCAGGRSKVRPWQQTPSPSPAPRSRAG